MMDIGTLKKRTRSRMTIIFISIEFIYKNDLEIQKKKNGDLYMKRIETR